MSYADKCFIAGASGSMASVDDNALRVTVEDRWKYAVAKGNAFVWASVTYDPAAGDTILGVENNDSTRMLYIKKIMISSDTNTEIKVFGASGVTMAGTNALSGVCLNRANPRSTTGIATAYDDETGNAEAAGNWATTFYSTRILANVPKVIEVNGAIALPNDNMIGVDVVADVAGANVTIWGWYE